MSTLPTVTIYTDGGCRPNPGPGGWGAVILRPGKKPKDLKGGEKETSNNRMELTAAIEALRFLKKEHHVELHTDSLYLKKGITEWLRGWMAKGWLTANKKPVKNQDLWQALADEIHRHEIDWHWVKGHAGNRWNERADGLASSMIQRESLPVNDPGAVHLFTSAAYSGKKKRGSWSVLLIYGDTEKKTSGRVDGTSANRMHILSAVEGLGQLNRRVRVHLYTASDYLKDGATGWIAGWRARGWTTREGKPVQHQDLWEQLSRLLELNDVRWHVVPRDLGLPEMDAAKMLAREALTGPD